MSKFLRTLKRDFNMDLKNKLIDESLAETKSNNVHDIVEMLINENESLKNEIALKDESISDRFSELAKMTLILESMQYQLDYKDQQILQSKQRINNLKNTVSWRSTSPIRVIGRAFKKDKAYKKARPVDVEYIQKSGYFNDEWYCSKYPEVKKSGLTPVEHYISHGAELGYNPSLDFDTCWYLGKYPDVADSDLNPLIHFLLHGKAEQRSCLPVTR